MSTRTTKRRCPALEALESRALLSGAGTLDPTFGTSGRVTTSFSPGNDMATSAFLQPDGKIVTVGMSGSPNWLWDLARYNTNGTLDTSFGTGGKASTPVHGYGYTGALDSDPANPNAPKFLEAGWLTTPSENFELVRFNNNCSLDTTFGSNGKVTGPLGLAGGVAVLPNGEIIVVGNATSTPGGYEEAAILRYNADGTLDTSFGVNGEALSFFRPGTPQSYSNVNGVAIQPDGKILVVGDSDNVSPASGNWTVVARYNTDGTPDTK
jgi:uncharacterized delta-60 repeat protein